MGTLLKGATLVQFEPARVEQADVRVDGNRIVASGPSLAPAEGDEVIDLAGKLLMPGLVCAHTHLYTSLFRTSALWTSPPEDFPVQLEQRGFALERALDLDAVQIGATLGALEALRAGVTTVMDQHASSRAIQGSLLRVARGVNEVGLRGVLSYQVTDHHGAVGREEGLEENVGFARRAQGRFRGAVGAHACCTLSPDALEGIRQALEAVQAPLHIGVAEAPHDERISRERWGKAPTARLLAAGIVTASTRLVHMTHLSWPELSDLLSTGAWIVHTPRSDLHSAVGHAPSGKFGARATLGTASLDIDLFAEVQAAWLLARNAGQPIDPLRYLANGQRMASECFGAPIGALQEGALADLVVLDYRPTGTLTAETLAAHVLFGLGARHVESVMVDGVWRLWARRPLSVAPDALVNASREALAGIAARTAAS